MFLYVNMKVHSSFPRTVHLQWLEESSKYFLLDMFHAESLYEYGCMYQMRKYRSENRPHATSCLQLAHNLT